MTNVLLFLPAFERKMLRAMILSSHCSILPAAFGYNGQEAAEMLGGYMAGVAVSGVLGQSSKQR